MQLEAYVIALRIVGRAVATPDVMIVLVTLIGGTLYGVLGALLAVPIDVAAHSVNDEARKTRRSRRARSATAEKRQTRRGTLTQ